MSDHETTDEQAIPAPPSNPPQAPPVAPAMPHDYGSRGRTPMQRSPFFAGVLSFVLPGLGNVYNGLMQRGLMTFLLGISLLFTAAQSKEGPILALLVPSMIFTWLFGIIDAARQASLINHGLTETDLPTAKAQTSHGGLAVGVAFFLIGTYGLFSQVFEIDLSVLADYWYALLMAFGGWMIYQSLQQRKNDNNASAEELSFDEGI